MVVVGGSAINLKLVVLINPILTNFDVCLNQGIGIKGREMALVWHEKASRTALQTGSLLQTHSLLVQTHTHDYSQGKCRTMSSIIIKLE